MASIGDNNKKFYFLHSHIAKEPYIYDVLNEISLIQESSLKTESDEMATLEDLRNSRNIKIPFSPVRNKTMGYLVDLLEKHYPDEFRSLITFTFIIDPETKKLTINEKKEYCVLLSIDTVNSLQKQRDIKSAESLIALLKQFRLFNLTKLIKKAVDRSHLTGLVKSEIGKSIFTFKNYALARNNFEIVEDFCFHRDHYNSVKKTLNIEAIKKIISANSTLVNRRLQKFGILNADFSDYRESKLDYLLNILMEDILPSLAPKDKIELKNFHSLRTCLLKVEKIIDPVITLASDITQFVHQNGSCQASDIIGVFSELDEERLETWASEHAVPGRILVFRDSESVTRFISGEHLLNRLPVLHKEILLDHDAFASQDYSKRQKTLEEMKILCNAAHYLLQADDGGKALITEDGASRMASIVSDFDNYQKKLAVKNVITTESEEEKGDTLFDTIMEFIGSLFSRKKKKSMGQKGRQDAEKEQRPAVSVGSKNIIAGIKRSQAKIIPLSNYIDIVPGNEELIEGIIDDLRSIGIKIVIPVYSARKQLYPLRSQQYLISDMEYLLVESDVIQSPETIRAYTDSLGGEKIRDESITGGTIIMIEKYLLSLHRQKKAQLKKKK